MKALGLVVLFLSIKACTYSQFIMSDEILGVWQSESDEIAGAWLDTYQFYSDGRFVFNLNQYDEARRVNSIKGHYRLSKDTLFLKVESTIELIDGYFERNTLTSVHGSWSLAGNVIEKEIKQPVIKENYTIVKRCSEKTKTFCMLIDGAKYFRISQNPNDYN